MNRIHHRLVVTLLATTVLAPAAALSLADVPPASAAGRVTVTNDRGGAQADVRYSTALTVSGAGFQTVRGGFGGVYVMFGWVDDPSGGTWKPSRGGLTGTDYQYIPDSEDAAANQGYLKFIAFPGSSTASEANGVLSASGGFSVELTVPGPVFQSVDRSGEVAEVDCRRVTCGVITIGAHGVKNASNETFTPVSFGSVHDTAPTTGETPAESAPEVADAGTTTTPGAGTTTTTTPAAPAGRTGRTGRAARPAVLTDRATAVAGRAMAFTGRGFVPGEQVVAVLDDGLAALGPMVAGASGEVAGVLQLPLETAVGTHELRLTGAASGTEVSERFPIAAGAAAPTATDAATDASADEEQAAGIAPGALFLSAAAVLFGVALARSLLRWRRRRPAGPTAAAPTGATA